MKTIFELAERLQSANTDAALFLLLAKATLILLIARLLLAAMPRASAATKHLVATATLVAVAAMPIMSVVVPAWELPVASGPVAASADVTPGAGAARQGRQPGRIGLTDTEETVPVAKSFAKAIVPTPVQRVSALINSTWKGMLILALGAISLLMLGHMLTGLVGVWFVARGAKPFDDDAALMELDAARDQLALQRDIRLLLSPRVSVPVVWGVFRPVLLLPVDAAEWPVERLRVVLLHELAHLKRVDGVSLILTRIAVSLFWFHPLAWSLERAGRNECERACDDLVLAGGTKPSDYADHLLAIARNMPAFDPFRAVTLAMSRKSQLEGRLLSILQPGAARRVFSGRGVLVACALAIAIIVPVSAMRLIAQPSKAKAVKPVQVAEQKVEASGSVVTVKPDVDSLEDYLQDTIEHVSNRFGHRAKSTYDRAYDLYRHERYAEAGDEFRKADQEESNDTALYNAACSYALAGDAAKASDALQDAIEKGWDDFDKIAEDSDFDPIRNDARFKGVLARHGDVATRRVDETVERYNELRAGRSRHWEDDDDEWYEVGLDLLRLRKLDDSIAAFEKAIELGEKNGAAMYNIACAYSLKGDVRNGLAWLDKAIENGYGDDDKLREDPDLALLRRQGEFEALSEKARDLELSAWSRFTWSWSSAAEHHKKMLARYPTSGRAWFNYGYASLQARDFGEAIKAYQKTIEMNYRPATASYNIACAYALQGNRDAAFDWLGRAEKAGFKLRDYLDDDEDLEKLHGDPRWRELEARAY